MAEVKISSLPVANTLSANDRVLVLVNPATAANVRTITATNFAASLVSSNAIPVANTTQLGVVKVDGNTIVISNGTISGAAIYNQQLNSNSSVTFASVNTTNISSQTSVTINIGNNAYSWVYRANGELSAHGNIIPKANNVYTLGNSSMRWNALWIGGNSVVFADQNSAFPDQTLTVGNGVFYIATSSNTAVQSNAGFRVGNFLLQNNTISLTDSNAQFFVGETLATGNLVFNRPVVMRSPDTGSDVFKITREGIITIDTPNVILTNSAAVQIIGSSTGTSRARNFTGTLLQGTAQDGQPARVGFDAFGPNTYFGLAGRGARGTVDAPQQTQANDTIIRMSIQGWTADGNAYAGTIGRINMQAAENFYTANTGTKITFQLTPTGSNTIQSETVAFTVNGMSFASNPSGGITFSDGSRQNTAFSNTSAVTRVIAGTGLTQSSNVGVVGIDATGVLSVAGTNNQVLVANVGQNITLSLPQNIGTNSTVQFNTLTVQNLTVTGNSTIANSTSISNAVIRLAFDSSNSSQIDGGGFTLGNTASAYFVSFTYNLANDYWDTNGAGLKTLDLIASNISANSGTFLSSLHAGDAFVDYDYPNAVIQADSDVNNYGQIVNQNHNSGTQASADFVAVNNIGTDSNNYIDLGINSSNYANADYSIIGPNDGYLYINGGDLALGTQTTNTGIIFFAGGTTANNGIGVANASGWFIDRLTVSNTIVGTANNTAFVGSVAAANVVSNAQLQGNLASYQTTAGLAANVVLLTSNAAGFLGNSSGTLANIVSWISGNAATAYSNAVNSFSGTYQTTAGLAANVATLTANNTAFVGTTAAANVVSNTQLQSNLTSYQTIVGLASNVVLLTANSTNFVGAVSAANVVSNAQLQGNLANYVSSSQLSSNLANYQTTAGLAANVVLLTANAANFIGALPAANVVSNAQLQGNLASYVTGTNLTSNLANYQTTAGLSANVVLLTANAAGFLGNSSGTLANIASWISGNSATAYSNAVANAAALYQTTAGLSANVATLNANNASFLGGVAANAYVNTAGSYTITGVLTHNANVVIGSNAGIVANGSVGLAGQYLTSNGSSVYWSNNVPKMFLYSIDVDRSLSTANTSQSLFGVGVTLNSDTRYRYKIYGTVFKSNTSGSSTGALRFAITNSTANAVLGRNYYLANPCAANSSQSSLVSAFQVSQSITNNFNTMTTITNSNTGATWYSFMLDGTLDVTTGGTLNPQISFTHSNGTLGAATVLQAGATIEFWPIGNATSNAVIGTWA
jgi:hypothetical protein